MMMKKFCTTAVAIGALAFAGSAFASQVHIDDQGYPGEPSLFDIATDPYYGGPDHNNALFGHSIDNSTTQSNDGYWTLGGSSLSSSVLKATWTSHYAEDVSFGVYNPNDKSERIALLGAGNQNGAYSGGDNTAILQYLGSGEFQGGIVGDAYESMNFGGDSFGFYLEARGETFFSDYELNSDGEYHMVGFQGDESGTLLRNEYLFGWDDSTAGNSGIHDFDFQDYVVVVESIRPVPGPSSLAMFGVGLLLIGFGGYRIMQRDC